MAYIPYMMKNVIGNTMKSTQDILNASQRADPYSAAGSALRGVSSVIGAAPVVGKGAQYATGSAAQTYGDIDKGIQYQVPVQQAPDFTGAIKGWGANTLSSLLAKIEAAKQQGISGYKGLDSLVKQQTQQGLNMNDVERARMLQKVYEATEASGGYRGGENITGQIATNTMAGQVAGQLRQNEINQLADIQKAIETINQQAEQEKVAAASDITAKELQAIMQAQQWGADYDLRAGQQMFEQNFANKQFDFSKGMQEQQMELERQKFTASQEWQNFQKQMAIDDANWSRSENNPAVRAQIIQNEIAQLKLQNLPREMALEIQKLEQDLQMGRVSMDEARSRIRNAAANINLQQQQLNMSRQQADRDNAFRNIQYRDQQQQYRDTQSQNKVNAYKNMIDQLYAKKDLFGAIAYDNKQIKNYIQSLNTTGQISDSEARRLLGMYGFTDF